MLLEADLGLHEMNRGRLAIRPGLAQTGNAVAFFPLAALFEHSHALEALHDIPFGAQFCGGLEAWM